MPSSRDSWLDLLAVQRTLKNLLQHCSSKAAILRRSAFFTVQHSHPYMTTGKTICTDYAVSWVSAPADFEVYYENPSHYHLPPELFWNFFLYILAAVLVVEYTIIWIISTSVFIYLLLDLNHSLLSPFHLSLPVGCTVCSHALCINILEIYKSVLYFLYCWILIIKTFTRVLNKFSLIRK